VHALWLSFNLGASTIAKNTLSQRISKIRFDGRLDSLFHDLVGCDGQLLIGPCENVLGSSLKLPLDWLLPRQQIEKNGYDGLFIEAIGHQFRERLDKLFRNTMEYQVADVRYLATLQQAVLKSVEAPDQDFKSRFWPLFGPIATAFTNEAWDIPLFLGGAWLKADAEARAFGWWSYCPLVSDLALVKNATEAPPAGGKHLGCFAQDRQVCGLLAGDLHINGEIAGETGHELILHPQGGNLSGVLQLSDFPCGGHAGDRSRPLGRLLRIPPELDRQRLNKVRSVFQFGPEFHLAGRLVFKSAEHVP